MEPEATEGMSLVLRWGKVLTWATPERKAPEIQGAPSPVPFKNTLKSNGIK